MIKKILSYFGFVLLTKKELSQIQDTLLFANSYRVYVFEANPELHKEANGTPEFTVSFNQAIKTINQNLK